MTCATQNLIKPISTYKDFRLLSSEKEIKIENTVQKKVLDYFSHSLIQSNQFTYSLDLESFPFKNKVLPKLCQKYQQDGFSETTCCLETGVLTVRFSVGTELETNSSLLQVAQTNLLQNIENLYACSLKLLNETFKKEPDFPFYEFYFPNSTAGKSVRTRLETVLKNANYTTRVRPDNRIDQERIYLIAEDPQSPQYQLFKNIQDSLAISNGFPVIISYTCSKAVLSKAIIERLLQIEQLPQNKFTVSIEQKDKTYTISIVNPASYAEKIVKKAAEMLKTNKSIEIILDEKSLCCQKELRKALEKEGFYLTHSTGEKFLIHPQKGSAYLFTMGLISAFAVVCFATALSYFINKEKS